MPAFDLTNPIKIFDPHIANALDGYLFGYRYFVPATTETNDGTLLPGADNVGRQTLSLNHAVRIENFCLNDETEQGFFLRNPRLEETMPAKLKQNIHAAMKHGLFLRNMSLGEKISAVELEALTSAAELCFPPHDDYETRIVKPDGSLIIVPRAAYLGPVPDTKTHLVLVGQHHFTIPVGKEWDDLMQKHVLGPRKQGRKEEVAPLVEYVKDSAHWAICTNVKNICAETVFKGETKRPVDSDLTPERFDRCCDKIAGVLVLKAA